MIETFDYGPWIVMLVILVVVGVVGTIYWNGVLRCPKCGGDTEYCRQINWKEFRHLVYCHGCGEYFKR